MNDMRYREAGDMLKKLHQMEPAIVEQASRVLVVFEDELRGDYVMVLKDRKGEFPIGDVLDMGNGVL